MVLSTLFALIFREPQHKGINAAVFSTKVQYSMYAPLFGTAENLLPPELLIYILNVFPMSITFAFIGLYLDKMQKFVRDRQPWVGLLSAASAKHNITLQYNSSLALFRSYKEKHWFVFILVLNFVLALMLPLLLAGLFSWNWVSHEMHPLRMERKTSWQAPSTDAFSPRDVDSALSQGIAALFNMEKRSRWVFGSYAILPVDLDRPLDPGGDSKGNPERAAFWTMQSQAVHTELHCHEVPATIDTETHTVGDGEGTTVTSMRIRTSRGSSIEWAQPCRTASEGRVFPPGTYTRNSFCGRWQFVDKGRASSWIVSFVYGLPRHDQGFTRTFDSEPSFVAFSCSPKVDLTAGNLSLVAPDVETFHHILNSVVKDYQEHQAEQVQSHVVRRFGTLLNESNSGRSLAIDEGILPYAQHIDTAFFTGDLLSFMTYRYGILAQPPNMDLRSNAFQADISCVFSTVFSYFALNSNAFNDNQISRISVIPIHWTQRIFVKRPFAYAASAIFLFSIGATLLFVFLPGRFSDFPVDVNSFEDILFLLYHSSLLTLFREQISSPEKMSLGQFTKAVENLSFRYRLGIIKTEEGETRWIIDKEDRFREVQSDDEEAGGLEVAQYRPYRDESTDNEDGDEEDRESTGDGEIDNNDNRRCPAREQDGDREEPQDGNVSDNFSNPDQHDAQSTDDRPAHENLFDDHLSNSSNSQSLAVESFTKGKAYEKPVKQDPADPQSSESNTNTAASFLNDIPPSHPVISLISGTGGRVYTAADFPSVKHLPDLSTSTPELKDPTNPWKPTGKVTQEPTTMTPTDVLDKHGSTQDTEIDVTPRQLDDGDAQNLEPYSHIVNQEDKAAPRAGNSDNENDSLYGN
jgi:hypothetical protein